MSPDAEQLKAVILLQSLFESLSRDDREEKNLLTKIFKKKKEKTPSKRDLLVGKCWQRQNFFDGFVL